MTTYTEQFAGMTTGVIPTNFTNRFAAATGYTVENPSSGEAEDDRALQKDGTISDGDAMFSFDDIDGDANRDECEVLVRMQVSNDASSQSNIWARSSGTTGSRTGYFGFVSAGLLRIGRYVADAFVNIGSTVDLDFAGYSPILQWGSDQTPFNFTSYITDTWFWLRFRVNGTGATVTCSLKIWVDGFDEPETWTLVGTDVTAGRIVAVGWCGFSGTPPSGQLLDVDYFSVGTNGDTPAIETSLDLSEVRLTQSQVSAAVNDADPIVRLTQSQVSAAVALANPEMRVTGAYVQVLHAFSSPPTPQTGPVVIVPT